MRRRPTRPLTLLAGSLAVAAAFSACAPDSSGSLGPASTVGTRASASTVGSSSGATVTSGEPAPTVPESLQFAARGINGSTIDVGQFAGRPLVLWFWAPG